MKYTIQDGGSLSMEIDAGVVVVTTHAEVNPDDAEKLFQYMLDDIKKDKEDKEDKRERVARIDMTDLDGKIARGMI